MSYYINYAKSLLNYNYNRENSLENPTNFQYILLKVIWDDTFQNTAPGGCYQSQKGNGTSASPMTLAN